MSRYANNPRRDRQEERIVKALAIEMTVVELAEFLCLSRTGTQRHLTRMINASPRRIYIARWDPTNGPPIAVYKAGSKRNAQRKSQTLPEIWAAIKADPARHAAVKASNARTRRKRKGLPPLPAAPASAFAALFTMTGSHA